MTFILKKPLFKKIVLNYITRLYCKESINKFTVLQIPGLDHEKIKKRERTKLQRIRPRYLDMNGDEDWTNMWPAAQSFNYSAVPLPIRQGHTKNSEENNNITPAKYANAELVKIPNFLHLTPIHIAKHCKSLKKYCTQWPENLSDFAIRHHFPLKFIQTNYIHSAPSIRDERARIVTLKFEMRHLRLDERERFKFIKLIGSTRYDKESDSVTIVADRCPSHRQNYDYLIYVLTALTKESKKFEDWELEVGESDWLNYKWEESKYKENMKSVMKKTNASPDGNGKEIEDLLRSSIEKLYNEGDSDDTLLQYKAGVVKLLRLGSTDCSQPVNEI